ncbi:MAG: hypothetical protein LHV68_08475 [Elusimicrobia bacterium]|nr:hypothetical protein [Candidatus Liberimonas magnetica]
MKKTAQSIIKGVNKDIKCVIKGTENIVNNIVDNIYPKVTKLVEDTEKNGEELIESLQHVISSTITSVVETGKNLENGVKALVIGILKGLTAKGDDKFISLCSIASISSLARAIIKAAIAAEADLNAATKGLLRGVIHSAKEMGIDVKKTASIAATEAVNAAYKFSKDAGNKVKKAATCNIDGVKIELKEPYSDEVKV